MGCGTSRFDHDDGGREDRFINKNNNAKRGVTIKHHQRRKSEQCGGDHVCKRDVERENNSYDNEEEEGGSDRIDPSSLTFMGSPSFREYCRPNDDEEEIKTRRREKNNTASNKGSGNGVAGAMKRRVRRFRKISPSHSPPALPPIAA